MVRHEPLPPFPGRLERQRKEIREPAQDLAKRPLACDGADTRSRFAASLPWIPDLLPLTLQSSGKRSEVYEERSACAARPSPVFVGRGPWTSQGFARSGFR